MNCKIIYTSISSLIFPIDCFGYQPVCICSFSAFLLKKLINYESEELRYSFNGRDLLARKDSYTGPSDRGPSASGSGDQVLSSPMAGPLDSEEQSAKVWSLSGTKDR